MTIKIVKLSEKGQIAIPIQIREKMKLKKGDELIVLQSGDKLMLQKTQQLAKEVEDDFRDIDRLAEINLREAWSDDEDDELWESYLK